TVQGLFFFMFTVLFNKNNDSTAVFGHIFDQLPAPTSTSVQREKEGDSRTMFPTKKMLALFQPTNPVPADLVQFSPGKLMRTDGLDVDKTLNDISQMFYATDTASISDQYMHRQYHGLFHRTASVSDLTENLYKRFALNPNSMAHWLPKVVAANSAVTSAADTASPAPFLIPETKIWRLPIELAQYIRIPYEDTTPASRVLFNDIISTVFELKPDTT